MDPQQPQPAAVQLNLHLAVRKTGPWAVGLQVSLGFEAMHRAVWYRPDGQEFRSADVCMTSLLRFQHHLSPVTNRQPTAKDVFLIILHSLNAAVTTVDVRMHAKVFCHVKIKLKSFLGKSQNLWSHFSRNIGNITFCCWQLKVFHCNIN